MPILRFTLKRIILSPSTWIIFVLACLLSIFLNYFVILQIFGTFLNSTPNPTSDQISKFLQMELLSFWKMLSLSFFILLLTIFISFKATQIFRSDLDDGTLLVLVSKPISRTRIWTEKIVTLFIVTMIYLVLTLFIGNGFMVLMGKNYAILFSYLLPYILTFLGIACIALGIFGSFAVITSLIMNSKATVAIMLLFPILMLLSNSVVDGLLPVDPQYYTLSQAAAGYDAISKSVSSDDKTWLDTQISSPTDMYLNDINALIIKMYSHMTTPVDYPNEYNPSQEQIDMPKIADGTASGYSAAEQALAKHIIDISGVIRSNPLQSYAELMTGNHVGGSQNQDLNKVSYDLSQIVPTIRIKISTQSYDNMSYQVALKSTIRKANPFYQLYYLFSGSFGQESLIFADSGRYIAGGDPYVFNWKNDGSGNYSVDTTKGTHKMLSFEGVALAYGILAIVLVGSSWYIFNRRDFT